MTGPRTEGIVGVWVPDIRRESKTRGRRSRRTGGGGGGRARWNRCTGVRRGRRSRTRMGFGSRGKYSQVSDSKLRLWKFTNGHINT